MKGYIIVNEKDNVATALRDFKKGEKVANIELLMILQADINLH